jgi:hypothetical protein
MVIDFGGGEYQPRTGERLVVDSPKPVTACRAEIDRYLGPAPAAAG